MVGPVARRLNKKTAFLLGAAAGLAMALVLLALRFALDTQVVTEVLADWLTTLLPGWLFDYLLDRLQFSAKWILFALVVVGQVMVGGALSMVYHRRAPVAPRDALLVAHGGLLTGILWLLLGGGATPLIGGGVFGASLPDGALPYSASLLASVAAYAFLVTLLPSLWRGVSTSGYSATRREFLRRGVVLVVVLAVGGVAVRSIVSGISRLTPAVSGRSGAGISPEITPNDDFYVISKSYVVPDIDPATWRLRVQGDVGNPFELTYGELLAMPAVEEVVTLTCISNPIGGFLAGNALWKGVPLNRILRRAELPTGTERLAFHAADGYVDSFPLEIAMRDNVLVAYEMNGEPLPPRHGFPARIIVPGLYGMEHVKWLERIEPVPDAFRGFWQQRGWADTAEVRTMSRFDVPDWRDIVTTEGILVGGIAFAGARGVRRVDVSFDGGATWEEAELTEPLSPYAWRIWTREWSAPTVGTHRILVRATDGDSVVQTAVRTDNFPSGPTGYHAVSVEVVEPSRDGTAVSAPRPHRRFVGSHYDVVSPTYHS